MTNGLLDTDDAALEDARRILGTRSMEEMANEALRRVARIEGSTAWIDLRDAGVMRDSLGDCAQSPLL